MMKKYSFADMQMLHWKDYEFECQRLTLPDGRRVNLTNGQRKQVQTQYTQYIDQHHHAPRMGDFIFPSRRRGHGCNFTGMVAAVAGGLR